MKTISQFKKPIDLESVAKLCNLEDLKAIWFMNPTRLSLSWSILNNQREYLTIPFEVINNLISPQDYIVRKISKAGDV
jgi:hypothetical protein